MPDVPDDDMDKPPAVAPEIALAVAGLTEVMANMTAAVEPLKEFIAGQRADFEQRGFSPTASEKMAMELWPALVAMLAKGILSA